MTKTTSIINYLKALSADYTQIKITDDRTWCF